MKVPRWFYVGGALYVLAGAGMGAASRQLSGPEHLTRNQMTERRGAAEQPAARLRQGVGPSVDADLADRAMPVERRKAERALAEKLFKGAFR